MSLHGLVLAFLEGLSALATHKWLVISALASLLLLGLPVGVLLWKGGVRDASVLLSASLASGGLLSVLAGYVAAILPAWGISHWPWGAATLLWFVALRPRGRAHQGSSLVRVPQAGVLAALLAAALVLRLAFVVWLFLPPYADGPRHYAIVAALSSATGGLPQAATHLSGIGPFYHLGFHAWVSWLVRLTGARIADAISVAGQISLCLLVPGIYLGLASGPGNTRTALAAAGLLAFGWPMPAFAASWGKYPAILGVALLPGALGLLRIGLDLRQLGQVGRHALCALIGLPIALAHMRVGLVFAAWALTGMAFQRVSRRRMGLLLALGLVLLALLVGGMSAATHMVPDPPWLSGEELKVLLAPYFKGWSLATTLVAIAAIPAAWVVRKRDATVALACAGVLLLMASIPLPLGEAGCLIDRPLAQMVLSLPLAQLGGLGFGSIPELSAGTRAPPPVHRGVRLMTHLGIVSLLAYCLAAQPYWPDARFRLATDDDLEAAAWAQRWLQADDVVAISASAWTEEYWAATDGGAWFEVLSGVDVIRWPHSARFDEPATHANLCARGITHVYVGGTVTSFRRITLEDRPEWYAPLLVLPRARIYQVEGCPPIDRARQSEYPPP